jgi:hypothetical protein
MDYNTSVLPPKVALQPPDERLVTFSLGDGAAVEPAVDVSPTVLMGVHTCDLRAIRLLDQVFESEYEDANYVARRGQTLIVSVECLRPCDEHSF